MQEKLLLPYQSNTLTNNCATQILEYLSGQRNIFDIKTEIVCSVFQNLVFKACSAIPYGQTRTSQEIAEIIGMPDSYRAIGKAIKSNPLQLIIPTHRILNKNSFVDKEDKFQAINAILRDIENTYS